MNSKKKKILAIVLVVLVLILGGASVYVATQMSQRQAVAPTAPTSKPAAGAACVTNASCSATTITGGSECTKTDGTTQYCCPTTQVLLYGACKDQWVGADACTATGSATEVVVATISAILKEPFANVASNSAGVYLHTANEKKIGDAAVVAPGETFVYYLWAKNPTTATYSGTLTFTDVLSENNLNLLTVVDRGSGCTYTDSTRTMVCTLSSVDPGTWGRAFRVKVANNAANGTVITNTVTASFGNATLTNTNTLKVVAPSATLTGSKTAYKNATSNTPGKYTLSTTADTLSKGQIFVYSINLKNTSTATATGVTVKDSLAEATNLTFMDAQSGCTWSDSDKQLTCSNITIEPGESTSLNFRVKVSSSVANGDVIANTAKITYNGEDLTTTKDLTVSTVVGCNNTCTTDEECSTGLTCDATTSKCRASACLTEEDCVCGTVVTVTPTKAAVKATATPTKIATATATPTTLPETGILDIPGIAAFGGGLFLAVVGILLAL